MGKFHGIGLHLKKGSTKSLLYSIRQRPSLITLPVENKGRMVEKKQLS
jgi:hypothetical protein